MIAERLRILRREKNMSKRELVSVLPLNYSTYANYESGFREPNSEVLQLLARHFGVSVDYLLGVSDNRRTADEIAVLDEKEHGIITKYRQLDSYGRKLIDLVIENEFARVSAASSKNKAQWIVLPVYPQRAVTGFGLYLDSDTADFEQAKFVPTPVSQEADFCVLIKGDSMVPKICDNDIVFVKAMPRIEADNVGIFVYDGEVMCKRLRVDNLKKRVLLESINRSYANKEITMPDKLQTIGMVIGIAERTD